MAGCMEKDYKKLYEEVFERARKMIFNNPETSKIIKEVIPEVLEETEDERIKRLLIKGFKDYGSGNAIFGGVKCNDIISWLEKQKQPQIEEKLSTRDDSLYHAINTLESTPGTVIDNVDGVVAADYFREWTIEDATEGDLLVCYNPERKPNKVQYGIFKHYNSSFDHDNVTCFNASIGLAWDGKLIINDYMGGSIVHPATIKQREQFKSSLKDNIRDIINQRPLFNIGDTIIHKELGGDYIQPHKIVRIDMLNKKYYSEDEYSVNFSEQDDYELFV